MFVPKLWTIVCDEHNQEIIRWTKNGEAFEITDTRLLSEMILGEHYKSNKYTAFARQLNYFGFRKVPNENIFWHPLFKQRQPEKCRLIQRKANTGNVLKKHRRNAVVRPLRPVLCPATTNFLPSDECTTDPLLYAISPITCDDTVV